MINAIGFSEIHQFLLRHHKASGFTKPEILAWIGEAEFQLSEGNGAVIEIPAHNSNSGVPITYTISKKGLDAAEVKIDE